MFDKLRPTRRAFASELPTSTPEKVGLSRERLARMDHVVYGWVDAGRTPGAITIVARHGKIVHIDVYGSADLTSGRKTRADDLFRMYSTQRRGRAKRTS